VTAVPATDMSTQVGSVWLPNPVMTAAGTSGHGAELQSFFDLAGLGAVVVKSLCADPWPGNAPPRVCAVPGGMLNAVGLQGPGVRAWAHEYLPGLMAAGARTVVSLWGRRVDDYGAAALDLAAALEAAGPRHGVVAVEVNVSCPNLEDRSRMFAHSSEATAAAVTAAKAAGLPLWAKLSPNTYEICEIAGAALEAGAEGITLVNTLLGLAIDDESYRLALGAGGGGLSGQAIHSVALRAIYDCRAAHPQAAIIGVGGVSDGRGAARMLAAGANAVQVGTASLADPRAPRRVLDELAAVLAAKGLTVADLIGAAHRREATDP
jgi:dihydroorotate dehydrogenase (NAD+) catalytic subunit